MDDTVNPHLIIPFVEMIDHKRFICPVDYAVDLSRFPSVKVLSEAEKFEATLDTEPPDFDDIDTAEADALTGKV